MRVTRMCEKKRVGVCKHTGTICITMEFFKNAIMVIVHEF